MAEPTQPKVNLFNIGARGVNVVSAPTHLEESELTHAQNAEYSYEEGAEAIAQRPGMTKINEAVINNGLEINSLYDIPLDFQNDKTPYLYVAYIPGQAHTWTRTADGTTWEDVDEPSSPFGVIASVGYWVNFSKSVTLNDKLYFVDASWNVREWDGETDRIVAAIPPGITGSALSTPGSGSAFTDKYATTPSAPYSAALGGGGSGVTYTYKVVRIYTGGGYSAVSAASSGVTDNVRSCFPNDFNYIQNRNVTQYDVYRSADGVNEGKIGSIPTTDNGGSLTTGNGSPGYPSYIFVDAGLTGDAATPPASASFTYATTYTYKIVARDGASYSAASAAFSVTGPATLDSNNWNIIYPNTILVSGATSYDIYRTVGGATQGKIGTIAVSAGNYTYGNGSNKPSDFVYGPSRQAIFADAGLTGDASTAPTVTSGTSTSLPLCITDMITDGNYIFLSTLDALATEPNLRGRILRLTPSTGEWFIITKYYTAGVSTPSTNTAGAITFYNGSLIYAEYGGTSTGNQIRYATTSYPNPLGGIWSTYLENPNLLMGSYWAIYNGNAYYTYLSNNAAINGYVIQVSGTTGLPTISLTSATTVVLNGYTALKVFQGRLFAAWTSGDGTSAAHITSFDGTTWTTEQALGNNEIVTSFVEFNGDLYATTGAVASYATTDKVYKRISSTSWTSVRTGTYDFRGTMGVVYI